VNKVLGSGALHALLFFVVLRGVGAQVAVTTLTGSGSATFANGVGAGASFDSPTGVAVDSSGNVIVADRYNDRIRKVTPGVW
jgi:DNA-binding beta-propeller fold protein YncE